MNFHRIFIIFWTIAIFKLFLVFPKKYLKIFVKLKRQKFFPFFFLRNCNICLFILNVQFWRLFFFEFVHFLSAKVHSLYEVFLSRKRRKFRLSKRWFFLWQPWSCMLSMLWWKRQVFVLHHRSKNNICEIWYKNVIFWVIIPFLREPLCTLLTWITLLLQCKFDHKMKKLENWILDIFLIKINFLDLCVSHEYFCRSL